MLPPRVVAYLCVGPATQPAVAAPALMLLRCDRLQAGLVFGDPVIKGRRLRSVGRMQTQSSELHQYMVGLRTVGGAIRVFELEPWNGSRTARRRHFWGRRRRPKSGQVVLVQAPRQIIDLFFDHVEWIGFLFDAAERDDTQSVDSMPMHLR